MEDNTEELKERLYKLSTSYNVNIADEIKNVVDYFDGVKSNNEVTMDNQSG